jgi:cysteine desulfurase
VVAPGVKLAPQLHGGNQEQGLRAGSLPVPLIVGLATALELALADQAARAVRLKALRDQLWQQLQELGGVHRNGAPAPRLAHNLNVWIEGVEGSALQRRLRPHLAISSGSACSSGEPSHVLQALGLSRQQAAAALRFGLGRHTSAADINSAASLVRAAVTELRQG